MDLRCCENLWDFEASSWLKLNRPVACECHKVEAHWSSWVKRLPVPWRKAPGHPGQSTTDRQTASQTNRQVERQTIDHCIAYDPKLHFTILHFNIYIYIYIYIHIYIYIYIYMYIQTCIIFKYTNSITLHYISLDCVTLHYHTLPYSTTYYHTWPSITMLCHTLPYKTIHDHTWLYITIHDLTLPYITIQYHTSPDATIHYCTSPYFVSTTGQGGGGSFRIGYLYESFVVVNHGWQSESTDGLKGGWIFFFLIAMVAVVTWSVTSPTIAGCSVV